MIVYVNGDSHTAAAEAVIGYAFAEDDPDLHGLGRRPHPENLEASWASLLARSLNATLVCDAESASSNQRILRTTRAWLQHHKPDLVIIQWSTWEREEWFHQDIWYQVNASGLDMVPPELQEKYRHYVMNVDWNQKTKQAHDEIWRLHLDLKHAGIAHLFFNGNNSFDIIGDARFQIDCDRQNWGTNYLEPYSANHTFDRIIRNQGIQPVSPTSWHFGKDGHRFFAQFMLQYITDNKLLESSQ